jgi:two-component system, NtrC family, response regulator HydG
MDGPAAKKLDSTTDAYLVTREGNTWRDVYRLPSGEVITLGRDAANHIVLADDRASRQHCQFFQRDSTWRLRDMDSRNGTSLNDVKITAEHVLEEGDVIRAGRTEFLFTHDISQSLNSTSETMETREEPSDWSNAVDESAEPLIVERKSKTCFLTEDSLLSGQSRATSPRQEFAQLYALIVKMLAASNVKELAEDVLDGLLVAIDADIGAVLLYPEWSTDLTDPERLRIVAYRAPDKSPYHRVSRKLSQAAIVEQQAILAMDIGDNPQQSEFRTLNEMEAKSVICAPIRHAGETLGLLHLYTLKAGHAIDATSLDLVLAVADQFATTLKNLNDKNSLALGLEQAQDENRSLKQQLEIESDLIGTSPVMRQLRDMIARVAISDTTTLVRGESGVGKELVARAVHFNSNRRNGPFICLNCAALTETLLESELFGHEKGSFTGATGQKIGKFEQADGGTLFLDEVGEMSLSIQAKFLRVLEGHPFERVGGSKAISVDVRLVAATNRDLESAVKESSFRQDLFYRLNVLQIVVPTLRQHADDIPALAEYFLERTCRRLGRVPIKISPAALELLRGYEWPGNIRELRNVIDRAVVLTDKSEIEPADIHLIPHLAPSPEAAVDSSADFVPTSLEDVERKCILRTLDWTNWVKREAAEILGINRSTLDRKLDRYGIRGPRADG